MQLNISITKSTVFSVLLIVAFIGAIGVTYGGENDFFSFAYAPQSCSIGKCVYGFDEEGNILCRPCFQSSFFRSCTWDENTAVIDHVKEYNFQYDGCRKGEEYTHGETCAISITETTDRCWYNGHWVLWKRATCRDGLWSKGTERYCTRD